MTREPHDGVGPGGLERPALGGWLVLVAPGLLVTRGSITLAFIVAPLLTTVIHVAVAARAAAAGLLLAQTVSTVTALRRPAGWSMRSFGAVLAIDFLLCGVFLGAERQVWGAGVPIAMVALAMSVEVAGWVSLGVAAVLVGAGFVAAVGLDISTPLVWPDTLLFGTLLSVETSFGGLPTVDAVVRSFPTSAHVETSFAGMSALAWTTGLLLPVLAVALAALGLGAAVNVWCVLRAAPAARWPMKRGSITALGLGLLLVVAASPASAQCDPSGRAVFVDGLEALSHGDLQAATRRFFELVQKQPTCPEARNNLAVLFVEQDRFDEAAEQLQAALQLVPNYERARVNLTRVEALRKERRGRCEQMAVAVMPEPAPTLGHPEGELPGAASVEVPPPETQAVEGTVTASAEATPTKAQDDEAKRVASPLASPAPGERRAAAVCLIEPARGRVCVYQRGEAPMAAGDCYAIAAAQVRSWPRWLVASEVTAQRIRLLDETGQTRLEIVTENAKVSGDALRLRKADWQKLAAQIVPWHTAWLIVE